MRGRPLRLEICYSLGECGLDGVVELLGRLDGFLARRGDLLVRFHNEASSGALPGVVNVGVVDEGSGTRVQE